MKYIHVSLDIFGRLNSGIRDNKNNFGIESITGLKAMKMKKIIKSFFYRGKDFQPPYFWITVLMCLVVVSFVMKLCGVPWLTDTMIVGVMGFVATWAALYNWNNKNGGKDV